MKNPWSLIRKRYRRYIILIVALVVLRFGLNFGLGFWLSSTFEKGTGATVSFDNPTVHFFPLGASIENLHLVHPDEDSSEGIWSKRVSIRFQPSHLFRKVVYLSDLNFEEARVISRGKDSGFLKTLRFVIRKPRRRPLSNWKARLHNISITPSKEQEPTLIVENKKLETSWNELDFQIVEIPNKTEGALFLVKAKSWQIVGNAEETPFHVAHLGPLEARARIRKGVLTLEQASTSAFNSLNDTISASGQVFLRQKGEYKIDISGNLSEQVTKNFFPKQFAHITRFKPNISTTAHLSGPIREGTVNGNAKIVLEEGSIPNLSESLELNTAYKINFNKILDFDSTVKFETLASTKASLHLDGQFRPFSLKTKVNGQIAANGPSNISAINAELDITKEKIRGTLREQGTIPKIQRLPAAPDKNQTSFETALNSNVNAKFAYDIPKKALTVEELSLIRFPLNDLAKRLGPVLSEKVFSRLKSVATSDSLVDGQLSFDTLTLGPKPKIPNGQGRLTVSDFKIRELYFDSLNMNGNYKANNLTLENIDVKSAAGFARGSGTISSAGEIDITASSNAISLQEIPAWVKILPGEIGTASAEFSISGNLDNPRYLGNAKITSSPRDNPEIVEPSLVSLSGDKTKFILTGDLLNNRAHFELDYPIGDSANQQGSKSNNLKLIAKCFDLPIKNKLSLTAELNYLGPRKTPLLGNGDLTVHSLSQLAVSDKRSTLHFVTPEQDPLKATIAKGRLSFTNAVLKSEDKELRLKGFVDANTGWNAALVGTWDIARLGTLLPNIEQLGGPVTADIRIEGPANQPKLSGPFELHDGSLSFPLGNSVIGAENVEILAEFSDQNLLISHIRAQMGRGHISGYGTLNKVFAQNKRHGSLELQLNQVSISPIPRLNLELDGTIGIARAQDQNPNIEGLVEISNGIYENTVDLKRILLALTRVITGSRVGSARVKKGKSADDLRNQTDMSIRILSDGGILVDTNLFRGELKGHLIVSGTPVEPSLEGNIEVLEGGFGSPSKEFEVIHGSLTFPENSDSLDPKLQITGEQLVRQAEGDEYLVQITIGGTITKPDVRFSSDSGLSEKELVSMVTLGGGVDDLIKVTPKNTRGSIQEYLDPSSSYSFGERVAGVTGFSVIELDSISSFEKGEVVPVIKARRPVARDLDFVLESELTDEETSSAGVDYKISQDVKIKTGWNSRSVTEPDSGSGSFNAGIYYEKAFSGTNIIPRNPWRRSEEEK